MVPTREAFEAYGIHVTRDGYACCPFHGEKTPSCKVYDGDRGWHCFGCHAGGDVLDFVQQYFGLRFRDAQAKLNDDFRLRLPIGQRLSREQRVEADRQAQERRRQAAMRKARTEQLEQDYERALSEFSECDIIVTRCAPVSPASGFSDAFAWALKNRDRAYYEMADAQAKLFLQRAQERG